MGVNFIYGRVDVNLSRNITTKREGREGGVSE